MSAKRPNLLLLMTDQQRFDTIAALGNPVIRTPALDRLVDEGTAFTRAFTPSPVCMSARCSLATGLPPHLTGVCDNTGIPNHFPSLMQRLSAAGYQTHGVGKMHFDPDYKRSWGFEGRDISEEGHEDTDFHDFLKQNGYGHVRDPNGLRSEYYYIPQPSQLPAEFHETRWVGDRSLDFLGSRDRSQPFFLWSSFIKPHPPFENPTPWNRLYRTAEMAPPFRPPEYAKLLNFWNLVQNRYKYRDAGIDDYLMRTIRAAYYSCISFVDQQIGRILDALSAEELDNTLVLFTSDHGELLGDYGSVGKRSMLDAACRVPLIARWPRHFGPGVRCPRPATLLDIGPTMLRAAGISDWEISAESCDLASVGAGDTKREYVFSQFSARSTGLYMAADLRWKYIYSAADEREWLLDKETDPLETQNLAESSVHAGQLARMRSACIERFRRDGYTGAITGRTWRRFGVRTLPEDPNYGLLFQDPAGLQQDIDSLGIGYSRQATVPGEEGIRLVLDCMDTLAEAPPTDCGRGNEKISTMTARNLK
jgi:arylsulfatase A-like enzyme